MDAENIIEIVLKHFPNLNINTFSSIFNEMDNNIISDYSFDSNDIGSLVVNTSDKKKVQIEKINIPNNYLDDNKNKILKLLEYEKLKSLSDNLKMKIFINIQMQIEKFDYNTNTTYNYKEDLKLDCFPYECKLCDGKVIIDNDYNIICEKNKNHKFTIKEYNNM